MRVIAGSARRLLLKTPKGMTTRPTSDQIKETLFNMLMPYLGDIDFLDLFSGSGGIGIEALSRGASKCVFVENNRDAIKCIKENLQNTHFTDKAQICEMDVLSALGRLEGKQTFDIIFMDPPYNNEYEEAVLRYLSRSGLIHDDTLIVVEASSETDFDYVDALGFDIQKIKEYKSNKHVFITRK